MNAIRFLALAVSVVWLSLTVPPFAGDLTAEGGKPDRSCLVRVVEQANNLRTLPERQYLRTLDGQDVALEDFYRQCHAMHPWCCLYEKFYYWRNEVKTVVSVTPHGSIAHKIRMYHNGMSTHCPTLSDPHKTHGDVVEVYDASGKFMGLAVYMGDGKYSPLPVRRYRR